MAWMARARYGQPDETPRIRMPANEKRAVSSISGGQSVTPILPATKAKLHSTQKIPM
jgi:hypothetical protein